MRYNVILYNQLLLYSNYVMMDLKNFRYIIVWRIINIKDNILHLEGEDRLWLPKENYFYFCKIGNKKFFPKFYHCPKYDFTTLYGVVSKGMIVTFDIELDNVEKQTLNFYLSYMNNKTEIFPSLGSLTHPSYINNSYYTTEKFIITNNNKHLIIYLYNKRLADYLEQKYICELQKYNKEYY